MPQLCNQTPLSPVAHFWGALSGTCLHTSSVWWYKNCLHFECRPLTTRLTAICIISVKQVSYKLRVSQNLKDLESISFLFFFCNSVLHICARYMSFGLLWHIYARTAQPVPDFCRWQQKNFLSQHLLGTEKEFFFPLMWLCVCLFIFLLNAAAWTPPCRNTQYGSTAVHKAGGQEGQFLEKGTSRI